MTCCKPSKSEADRRSCAAAMCHTCLRAKRRWRGPRGVESVECRVSGKRVLLHIMNEPCPLGKHPDKDGVIRWAWAKWVGPPMPLRWILWAFTPNHRPPSWYAGCGCLVRLRALTARIFGQTGVSHGTVPGQ